MKTKPDNNVEERIVINVDPETLFTIGEYDMKFKQSSKFKENFKKKRFMFRFLRNLFTASLYIIGIVFAVWSALSLANIILSLPAPLRWFFIILSIASFTAVVMTWAGFGEDEI